MYTHPLTGRPTHGQKEKRGRQRLEFSCSPHTNLKPRAHTHMNSAQTNLPDSIPTTSFRTRKRIGW